MPNPNRTRPDETSRVWLPILTGAAGAAALAGAALFFRKRDEHPRDDAPVWTTDKGERGEGELIGKTLLIGRPAAELCEAWRDFTRFPQFMDNVEAVERLDAARSRWTIAAPAGQTVTLVTKITEDLPNEKITWQSEPESEISTSGAVTFDPAPVGRGTYVSLVMRYDPPGGALGKVIAKLFQREPAVQARRDLRRFKQLMETGEVTVNASPSGRSAETPTEARV